MKEEIECWFPFLSDTAIVIFHDTNMPGIYNLNDDQKITWDNN